MFEWPPDSEWWFEALAVDRDSAIERGWGLLLCAQRETLASIFMLWGDPLETIRPPCGLNPIYQMLPPTKRQSLSSPLWENKWPRHKAPGTRNTSATLSFSCHHLHRFPSSTWHHSNWWAPGRSLGQCGARLMRCGSDGPENRLSPGPNDHSLITNEWEGMERSHRTDEGK